MFDAADGLDFIAEIFQITGFSLNDNGFQAVMVIQMEMLGAENFSRRIMLNIQKLVDQIAPVMIVNHPKGSNHLFPGGELLPDMLCADQ